ncbi:hypothetical protein LRS12_05605 [Sphingomonas sp. J344]|nr:hypothetical protein [Sphingomonas sp. J344]MCR5870247.1 hypothetical protein [Sphingomonas sp. J344]
MIGVEATGRGRPLRFVAMVAVGWVAMRVILLWPENATLPEAIEAAMPLRLAQAAAPEPVPVDVTPQPRIAVMRPILRTGAAPARHAAPPAIAVPPPMASMALLNLVAFGAEQERAPDARPLPRIPAPPAMLASRAVPNRWQASAWLVTRRGGPAGGAMLGGDQAGVRVARAIDRRGRLALYARASAPMAGTGRELALGIEWRPWRAPMRFLAEQRIALDHGRSGPAVAAVGG